MKKSCTQCSAGFEITKEDLEFYDKISPVFNRKKELVPPPTLCPACRMQRRLVTRNERYLYHRKCGLTGRQIVSAYAPDSPYTVYQSDEWFSDKWDAHIYGRDMDFNRPFFPQFAELKRSVPRMALVTSPQAEEYNCMYINFAGHSKNCYMTFDSDYNEDSFYTKVLKHSKFCMDCSFVHDSELCYECIDCYHSYDLRWSINCSNCSNSAFLQDCIGCRHCFFCVNLVQKEYHIYNKPYSKEEYGRIIKELNLSSISALQTVAKDFLKFSLSHPRKCVHTLKTENVVGDYIHNVQNAYHCYDVADGRDLRFCDSLYKAQDCTDVSSFGENVEMCYECATAGIETYHALFCFEPIINCVDVFYCDEVRSSKYCFGCAGMQRAEYCILNKQYTQEEYEDLASKIIAHMRSTAEWGEYFPPEFSSFGYNETVAQEYFPLEKEEVLRRGWQWRDAEDTKSQYLGPQYNIPDALEDVPDDITQRILSCEITGVPYKIIPKELQFYRERGLPIPRKCPDQRHKERIALRNPRKLWKRSCAKCSKDIQSTYAPDRPEIVYCEHCYLETVY